MATRRGDTVAGGRTRYGYRRQPKPSIVLYEVYPTPLVDPSPRSRIGIVWREKGTWKATLHTDPLIMGSGRTRDDAVDDAKRQVGDG